MTGQLPPPAPRGAPPLVVTIAGSVIVVSVCLAAGIVLVALAVKFWGWVL